MFEDGKKVMRKKPNLSWAKHRLCLLTESESTYEISLFSHLIVQSPCDWCCLVTADYNIVITGKMRGEVLLYWSVWHIWLWWLCWRQSVYFLPTYTSPSAGTSLTDWVCGHQLLSLSLSAAHLTLRSSQHGACCSWSSQNNQKILHPSSASQIFLHLPGTRDLHGPDASSLMS